MLRRLCRVLYSRWYWVMLFVLFNGSLLFCGLDSKLTLPVIGIIFISISIKAFFVARELKRRE